MDRNGSVCQVLREDPELAEAIDPARRAAAIEEFTVRTLRIPPGRWLAHEAPLPGAGIGCLVLSGILIRRVAIGGRFAAEVLGDGDLLRPWQDEDAPMLSIASGWSVTAPARLALLDERFAAQLARYPELSTRLFARAVRRSRHLLVNLAIIQHARVADRLLMLFWHLAGRWGRVRGDGVFVSIRLTHTVLADLVAARRPTVTTALSELARRGLVRPIDDGWLLSGDPPCTSIRTSSSGARS